MGVSVSDNFIRILLQNRNARTRQIMLTIEFNRMGNYVDEFETDRVEPISFILGDIRGVLDNLSELFLPKFAFGRLEIFEAVLR